MPHIIIEHSHHLKKSDSLRLGQKIVQKMTEIEDGNFPLKACKVRSFCFDEYFVGGQNQDEAGFVHVTIKVLAGRSEKVKVELGDVGFEAMQKFVDDLFSPHPSPLPEGARELELSLDVADMDREFYRKS